MQTGIGMDAMIRADRQRQTKSVLVLALSSAMVRPAKACVSCMRASSKVLVRIVVSVSSMLARASCAFIRVLPSACQLCMSGVWNLLTLACKEQREHVSDQGHG